MATYKQVGTLGCYSCGEKVPVKENENGGLSFPCPWCDFPAYAKAGTQAAKIARQRMTALPVEPAAMPKQEEKPAAPIVPTSVPTNKTIFG